MSPSLIEVSPSPVAGTADFATQNGASIIDGGYNGVNDGNIGVLANSGTAVVENFIIQNSYGGGDGGGVYIYQSNFTLTNSTLKNNISTNKGAGIYSHDGTLTVLNSTISGNGNGSLTDYGGGIYVNTGTATITNSTIAYNSAIYGGGIGRNTGTYTIKNTIIANNTATTSGPDCNGTINSANYNIIENNSTCTITTGTNNLNADPQIDSNLTETSLVHKPLSGSPAINGGDPNPASCPARDQLGHVRPHGSVCDIGAVEDSATDPTYGVIKTYTANNGIALPGTFLCDQTSFNCTNGSNPDADKAHRFALGIYQFYANKHNRWGIANNDMPIISTVHYGNNIQNAFWYDDQMVFGDGYSGADDVVGHEFTHGVTQYESNLILLLSIRRHQQVLLGYMG